MEYGDYRSARGANLPREAWNVANNIKKAEEKSVALNDWWDTIDMHEVAKLVRWSRCGYMKEWGDANLHQSLFMIGYNDWSLMLGDVEIRNAENFDTSEFNIAFAKTVATEVSHIWKDWAIINAEDMLHNVFHALSANAASHNNNVVATLAEEAASFAKAASENSEAGSNECFEAMAASEAAYAAYCYAYSFREHKYGNVNHAKDTSLAALNCAGHAVMAGKISHGDIDTRYNHRLTYELLKLIKSRRHEPPFKKKRNW